MSTIVTRAGKGSPLTNNELDANFVNLNTDKYQSGDSASFVQADVDNLRLDGNTLSSTNTDGDVIISPNGSGVVNMSSSLVTNVSTPVSNTDAANKAYVDTLVASGIHYHTPVRVESPTALTVTYNNGTAGVGATLTNAGAQAALVIDGVTLSVNDRVLIYTQADATQNGIYTVTNVGSGSTNWVLTRAADADTFENASPTGLSQGSTVFVSSGTTGAGETYTCNTTGTITFGTTNITFAQVSAAQVYSAGTALSLTGTQFAVSLVPIANGGTGQTTANAGLNALLPSQATHANKFLKTDGTNTAWANVPSPNNGTLSLAVSGTGLSGSASFTADQSGNSTFTVTSNATSANTASTIVARDASGNFSAGTITASLDGNAATATSASSATSATNATNVNLTNDTSTNSTHYFVFGDVTSGNDALKVSNTKATFNPSTGSAVFAGDVTSSSDERLKTNWRSVQEDFVAKLAGVKSGVYDRTDIEATQAGVSAQSLEEVLSEVVITAPDGLKSVNYGNAALVAAIELAKQVVELRKEIAELKGK